MHIYVVPLRWVFRGAYLLLTYFLTRLLLDLSVYYFHYFQNRPIQFLDKEATKPGFSFFCVNSLS